ncbi:hypothetical protein F170042I7_16320 [Blautia caecimuris]
MTARAGWCVLSSELFCIEKKNSRGQQLLQRVNAGAVLCRKQERCLNEELLRFMFC